MALSAEERRAVLFAPLALRAVLGITFLWAGLGKLQSSDSLSGQEAAVLANMGLIDPPARRTTTPTDAPAVPLPKPTSALPASSAFALLTPQTTQSEALPAYQASDFPKAVEVRRIWSIALLLYQAGHPTPANATGLANANSSASSAWPIWPVFLSEGMFPKVQAIGVTALEIIGGGGLLIGLFTRSFATGFLVLMLGALWLTQIGPAVQSGVTNLGFLPAYPAFDERAWALFFWQLALLGTSDRKSVV